MAAGPRCRPEAGVTRSQPLREPASHTLEASAGGDVTDPIGGYAIVLCVLTVCGNDGRRSLPMPAGGVNRVPALA